MSEHDWGDRYEAAIRQLNEHVTRAEDGTFRLNVEDDGKSIGIDPVIFADLKRSLEETNKLIRSGAIKPLEITD